MIPIACKITNFSLYLFVYFFESIIILAVQFAYSYRYARKNGWCMPQRLIIGTLISQYALHSALLCSLYSSISKEQHDKSPWNLFSHNRKYGEYVCKTHVPKISYQKTHNQVSFVLSYVFSIIQQYKQRTAWKASLQSIQPLRKIHSWNACSIFRYMKAITPQFQQCQTHFMT